MVVCVPKTGGKFKKGAGPSFYYSEHPIKTSETSGTYIMWLDFDVHLGEMKVIFESGGVNEGEGVAPEDTGGVDTGEGGGHEDTGDEFDDYEYYVDKDEILAKKERKRQRYFR